MLLTILLVNATALAGVLAMARYSVMLVDERGETLTRDGAWHERRVYATVPVSRPHEPTTSRPSGRR
jgi:hypothetical protein